MSAAWFCPSCQKYHAPHIETCPAGEISTPFTVTSATNYDKRAADKKIWTCPECGKPEGQCDPEGVGHYRG